MALNRRETILKINSLPTIDEVGLSERVKVLSSRSVKSETKEKFINLAISCIDLTTLEGTDTQFKIQELFQKALNPLPGVTDVPSVAAICIFPTFIADLKKSKLYSPKVKIATVAGAFPHGKSNLSIKLKEVEMAIDSGADEIDIVIDRGEFLSGNFSKVYDDIMYVKELTADRQIPLKVILETGELGGFDNINKAATLALCAGADFIKTSTGKINISATPESSYILFNSVKQFYQETNLMRGIKPSGGIKTTKQALAILSILSETLGTEWMNPAYFRFGASSLLDDLLLQKLKAINGHYQSKNYIPISSSTY
jgi:deoxyribose-phosphate aldolase